MHFDHFNVCLQLFFFFFLHINNIIIIHKSNESIMNNIILNTYGQK